MHRDLVSGYSEAPKGEEGPAPELRTASFKDAQLVFENLALQVLREVGRPMKSPEIVQEFKNRGFPLAGNEIRTAWNRLWTARAKGLLTNEPGLGYWIAGEPLSDEARERAAIASKNRPKSGVSAIIKAARGTKKGRDPVWGPEQIATAERMLLEGKSRAEVAAALGGVSQATIHTYIPGGIKGLQERNPDVVIPKQSYRPRPGFKPKGRRRVLMPEQEREVARLRAEGKSIQELCEMTKLSRTAIYIAIKRAEMAIAREKSEEQK